MRKRRSLPEFKAGILAGDRVILAQAITLVESELPADQALARTLIQEVLPYTGGSFRIGITGVPGVGKSSFIEVFGIRQLDAGKKVAVLAVDPSSSLSKGSILGDKTRMERLALDKRAFIRPSPSRSTLGGVAGKTREAILLCEAAGFDLILVETVGVGQSETAVKSMVDFFLLLLLAGAGDELQGIKKGIVEMADGFLIHKADGDNLDLAAQAMQSYQNAVHLLPPNEKGWTPKLLLGSSLTGLGMQDLERMLAAYQEQMKVTGFWDATRGLQRLTWLDDQIQEVLGRAFVNHPGVKEILEREKPGVQSGLLSPSLLAQQAVDLFLSKK
ncbi:MAG: methylmalonyl Co-A mutase-associated GTPase MeaB [Bacteroidetes bacterium]|nr:methylmalonyl Co-A mutase-associated GTPase MeaB [Bacteroidota bacterium]